MNARSAHAQEARTTETLVLRALSIRTYSSTFNDDKDHPVQKIDDLSGPKPIGPGRGAGTWVFINNKLVDYGSGADAGFMRGMCWTLDHGPKGPWTRRTSRSPTRSRSAWTCSRRRRSRQ